MCLRKTIEIMKGELSYLFYFAYFILMNTDIKFEAGERKGLHGMGALRGAIEGFPEIAEPKGLQN